MNKVDSSKRMFDVQTPIIPIVHELIGRYPGTISLGQGVVHYPPPASASEGIAEFFRNAGSHIYGPVGGIVPLLDLISDKLKRENGMDVAGSASRIVVTAGGNMAFLNAVLAICDVGDEVIVLSPYYFNHTMAITMASAVPVAVTVDQDYQPRIDAIAAAITPRTRAVVTVSPNNPTGAVYSEDILRRINALCAQNGICHIHDEAYEYFTYDGVGHFSPGSIGGASGHTISLYSLSKAYGFASWRIGYMVIPQHLFPAVQKVQDTNLICPPGISQYAAVHILRGGSDYCRRKVLELAGVRQLVLDHLGQISRYLTVPLPQGAMYFFAKVNTRQRDMDLVTALVRDFRVAVVPGSAFGVTDGCYLRISYGALERPNVAEGMDRLVRGIARLVGEEGRGSL
jgi:aspartate/methionine/tyrosine aminotransferase